MYITYKYIYLTTFTHSLYQISHAATVARAHLKFSCWRFCFIFWFYFKSCNYFRKLDFGFVDYVFCIKLICMYVVVSHTHQPIHFCLIELLLFACLISDLPPLTSASSHRCTYLIIKYLKS